MPRRVIRKLPSLGRRAGIDRFDPNAIDADGDGLVQETTRFERPGTTRGPKPSNVAGSMGRVRTEATKERDARIVDKWKKGESTRAIAESEDTSEAAVGWAINQARKRGEITEPRRAGVPYSVSKPKPKEIPKAPIKVEGVDKEILDAYDSGTSINEIAKNKNVKREDVLKALVKYRLPDEDGKFSIPRKKLGRGIRGAMSRQKDPSLPARNKRITDAYNSGKKPEEIAEEEKLPLRTIRYVLTNERAAGRAKIPPKGLLAEGQVRPGLDERNKRILKSYTEDKKKPSEIAEEQEIPLRTVRYVLAEARRSGDLPSKPRGREPYGGAENLEARNKRIADAYNSGKKPEEIAQQEKLPLRTVRYVLTTERAAGRAKISPTGVLAEGQVRPGLEDRNKRIIKSYTEDEKKPSEIAEEEGIPLRTVRYVLTQARRSGQDVPLQRTRRKKNTNEPEKTTGSMGIRLSPEKNAEIEKYLKDNPGSSNNYVAKKFNVSLQAVARRKAFLGLPASTWLLSDKEKQEIDEVIKNNSELSDRQLSRITGKSVTTIRSRRKALGIQPPKNDTAYLNRISAETIKAIDDDIKRDPKQFTIEIARTHGVSGAIVRARRELLGLPSPVTGATAFSSETYKAVEEDIKNNPELTVKQIAEKNNVSVSFVIARRRAIGAQVNPTKKDKENLIGEYTGSFIPESIKDEVVNGYTEGNLTLPEIAEKLKVSETSVRKILKERGVSNRRGQGSRAKNRNESSARARRRSRPANANPETTIAPGEVVKTPGLISGSMANQNKNIGLVIPTTTSIDSSDPKKVKVSIKYGEVEMPSFEADIDAYSEWEDTYRTWFGWIGNYGMRLASAALMGEPLPEASGYLGKESRFGDAAHDIIQTGLPDKPDKFRMSYTWKAGGYVRAAFMGLHHINSGKEVNMRPIYRGISEVMSDNPLLNLSDGEIVTLPLSAFTPDIKAAKIWAMPNVVGLEQQIALEKKLKKGKKLDSAPGIILEVLPGARTGYAAGDQYLHEFELDGELVTDVAEQLTQGRFRYVRTTTEFIEHDGKLGEMLKGERTKVTKITLEQVETFNPVTGKFEKNIKRRSKKPSQRKQNIEKSQKPVNSPGAISGSMANDNPRAGRRIKTETEVKKLDGSKYAVKVKYGDMDFKFEADQSSYAEWEDAYDLWVGWYGNYSMRLASASLMNEPLPKTFGYQGDDEGTHEHDLLGSGKIVNPARSEISGVEDTIKAAFAGLGYINSGNETSLRPIYRGLTNVTNGEEIMNLGAGELITFPLSAFTSDINTATYYATRGDEDIPNVVIEIMPGAKIGNAAGEQYQHQFMSDGEWVTDVTEQVTQGKFKFVRMSTSYVQDRGTTKKIKTVTLEQVETFNPYSGKFEKHVGKKTPISGSIGTPSTQEYSRRLGEIREVVRGLVPSDMQTLRDRAVDNYVKRNPIFIKRLVDINSSNSWENSPDAINPDGTKMTKAQYIAMVNAEQISQAQEYISRRLNNYSPDFNPWHLQQLQHNVETMYLSSPQMQVLADAYGYPQFAIFRSQEIIDKDSKPKFVPNEEAYKDPKGIAANGTTLMYAGVSGIMPYGNDAFIQKGEKIADALSDRVRRATGHWGLSPEYLLKTFEDDPFQMINLTTEAITDVAIKRSGRPWVIDEGHPVSPLRHEASHAIHASALAKASLDMRSNPTADVKDAHSLLSIFNKKDWESAALVDRLFAQMMMNGAISDYASTGPAEWLAETLSAAISPSRKTRNLVSFNHRAILARAFPELYSYLVEGDWP